MATGLVGAAEAGGELATKFRPVPPCSTLVVMAKANKIPLDGIEPLGADDTLHPGDSVTALLTLFEKGGRRTQWLLYLQAVQSDGSEEAPKPRGPMVLYSSVGTKIEFVSSQAFGSLRTLGPFVELEGNRKQPKVSDKTDRFVLDQGFLALGFEQAAATILRIRDAKGKGTFNFRGAPFSEGEIAQGRELAKKVQLTDAEERALAGGVPALISYFGILQHASGLEDIAMKVVARPSLWSIVRHAGVTAGIYFKPEKIAQGNNGSLGFSITRRVPETSAAKGTNAPVSSCYHIPLEMQLNSQPALYVTLVVVPPNPPLLLCSGAIGLLAEKPGDKETYLTLRVVSAKRGSEK